VTIPSSSTEVGWVSVRWDKKRETNSYRVGAEGAYDLSGVEQATTSTPTTTSASLMKEEIGVRVRRGPSWRYGDQDGGLGSIGMTIPRTTTNVGWVRVRWDSGMENEYRVRAEGAYDLIIVLDQAERPRMGGQLGKRTGASVVTPAPRVGGVETGSASEGAGAGEGGLEDDGEGTGPGAAAEAEAPDPIMLQAMQQQSASEMEESDR